MGSGKSTVINSLLSSVNNRLVRVAKSMPTTASVTTEVTRYDLESISIQEDSPGYISTCVTLWDTPGFTYTGSGLNYQHRQMGHMVEGWIPDGFENLDKIDVAPGSTAGCTTPPTPADKMHVVFLVVKYDDLEAANSPYLTRLREFITLITNKASPYRKSKSVRAFWTRGCPSLMPV